MSDNWIKWDGNGIPEEEYIEVEFRDGSKHIDRIDLFFWDHQDLDSDIVAYRRINSSTDSNKESYDEMLKKYGEYLDSSTDKEHWRKTFIAAAITGSGTSDTSSSRIVERATFIADILIKELYKE